MAAIIAALCMLIGFIGILVPLLPGVPVMYGGLLLYALLERPPELTPTVLVVFGLLTVVSLIIDWASGLLGAKQGKASVGGLAGGIVGLIAGLLFSPLGGWSIVVLPVVGVIIGELAAGRTKDEALESGMWTFVGYALGVMLNLIIGTLMIVWFIRALI